jgi:murein DD-endopeptidase MepM/ murein hydrolase activator NlpD
MADSGSARQNVLLAMALTGGIVIVADAHKGSMPRPRNVLGLGFAFMGLAALADPAPSLAIPFAWLVAISTMLDRGPDALAGVGISLNRDSPAPVASSASLLSGSNPVSNAIGTASPTNSVSSVGSMTPAGMRRSGNVFGGGSPVASSDGGDPYKSVAAALTKPLQTFQAIIGRPYQGTHTNYGNWESDNAVDLQSLPGKPVYAVADGVIGSQIGALNSSDPHLLGQRLHLVTSDNEFYYQHLQTLTVHAGQTVKAGQLLGYTGGMNHLHFASKYGSPLQILGLR